MNTTYECAQHLFQDAVIVILFLIGTFIAGGGIIGFLMDISVLPGRDPDLGEDPQNRPR